MRKWMLLAGGLCAGLVLAEGICRLTVSNPITGPPDPDRTSWRVEGLVNDPLVGFSFQPGFSGRMSLPGDYDVPFRISPQGLRDDRIFGPTHEGITRILLVGDSFVFGVGVELQDTLGALLESTLNADGSGSQQVQVVPVGVPSYGLDDYTKLVERWIPLVKPDLVLVAFFSGNDMLDYDLKARDKRVVIEGRLAKERQAWSWGLRKYSVLAHLLLQRFNPLERIEISKPLHPTPKDLAQEYRSMQPWIARLAAAPGPDGPPLAVWLLSEKFTVLKLRSGDTGYVPAPLGGVISDFRRLGCKVFEPVQAWVEAPDPVSRYFFIKDAHYSADGTRLLAHWLAPQLRKSFGPPLAGQARGSAAAETMTDAPQPSPR